MSKKYKVFKKNENKKIRRISDVGWSKVNKKKFVYDVSKELDSMMSRLVRLELNLINKQHGTGK